RGRSAAGARSWPGRDRHQGHRRELRRLDHGGRALPDEAAIAVQSGARDGRRRGSVRRGRHPLPPGRPRDGEPPVWRVRGNSGAADVETFARRDAMPSDEAGAFPIAYLSSHVAIRWQAHLEAGETLLVLGAAGGVGLTAVEIGKAMGARVLAAASTAEKLAAAR